MNVKNLILLLLVAILVLPLGIVRAENDDGFGEFLFVRRSSHYNDSLTEIYSTVEIYRMNLDTMRLSKVVDGFDPDVSPDGVNIAFIRDVKTLPSWRDGELVWRDQSDLFILDIETKIEKNLTDTRYYLERNPKISPDGGVVAYARHARKDTWESSLCFIDTDGFNNWCLDETWPDKFRCNLPNEEETDSCATLSKSHKYDLFDIDESDMVWLPNQKGSNTQILLLSSIGLWTQRGEDEVYAIELEDGALKSVELVGRGLFPSISKDGLTMFYQNAGSVQRSTINGLEIEKIVDVDENFRLWPDHTYISPNEDKLAYITDSHVWLSNIDGTDAKPIIWSNNVLFELSWTPNGNLVYSKRGRNDNILSLYLYNVKTTETTRITYPPSFADLQGGDQDIVFFP